MEATTIAVLVRLLVRRVADDHPVPFSDPFSASEFLDSLITSVASLTDCTQRETHNFPLWVPFFFKTLNQIAFPPAFFIILLGASVVPTEC